MSDTEEDEGPQPNLLDMLLTLLIVNILLLGMLAAIAQSMEGVTAQAKDGAAKAPTRLTKGAGKKAGQPARKVVMMRFEVPAARAVPCAILVIPGDAPALLIPDPFASRTSPYTKNPWQLVRSGSGFALMDRPGEDHERMPVLPPSDYPFDWSDGATVVRAQYTPKQDLEPIKNWKIHLVWSDTRPMPEAIRIASRALAAPEIDSAFSPLERVVRLLVRGDWDEARQALEALNQSADAATKDRAGQLGQMLSEVKLEGNPFQNSKFAWQRPLPLPDQLIIATGKERGKEGGWLDLIYDASNPKKRFGPNLNYHDFEEANRRLGPQENRMWINSKPFDPSRAILNWNDNHPRPPLDVLIFGGDAGKGRTLHYWQPNAKNARVHTLWLAPKPDLPEYTDCVRPLASLESLRHDRAPLYSALRTLDTPGPMTVEHIASLRVIEQRSGSLSEHRITAEATIQFDSNRLQIKRFLSAFPDMTLSSSEERAPGTASCRGEIIAFKPAFRRVISDVVVFEDGVTSKSLP